MNPFAGGWDTEAMWTDRDFIRINATAYRRCKELGEAVFVVLHNGAYMAVPESQLRRFRIEWREVVDVFLAFLTYYLGSLVARGLTGRTLRAEST